MKHTQNKENIKKKKKLDKHLKKILKTIGLEYDEILDNINVSICASDGSVDSISIDFAAVIKGEK